MVDPLEGQALEGDNGSPSISLSFGFLGFQEVSILLACHEAPPHHRPTAGGAVDHVNQNKRLELWVKINLFYF